ncbi:MAG: ABC transporter ATP-binding protein, partial [Gammaproteobacteria bacterium]
MIKLKNLTLQRGVKRLFENANLTIHPGWRVGLTGANGTGKSSLFALIMGRIHADQGDVELPGNPVIAWVSQETPASERSALDYALDGDAELREVEAAMADASDAELGNLHARMDAIDGYTAPSRAARLLHGLGFRQDQLDRPVSTFSGGWRMRLNLAQALMCRSDILLLDEPTNHLDLESVIWLEQWLKRYTGTLLLISHDREFLDGVAQHIMHIEQGRIELYAGNYTAFERQRAEKLAQQQAMYQAQQKEIAHLQRFVDRFRAKAT